MRFLADASVYIFLRSCDIRLGDNGNLPPSIYVATIGKEVMLTIDVEKTSDVVVVRCIGRIVRGQPVRTLRNAVVSEADTRMIVLDLSEVESLDAGGLTALVSLHHWTRAHGMQLKLVNPSHFVADMLACTHLNCVFDISSLDDAILVLSGADLSAADMTGSDHLESKHAGL
jgi:anti-anti-sigma factor